MKLTFDQVVKLDNEGNIVPHVNIHNIPVAELIKQKKKFVTNAANEKYIREVVESVQEDGTFIFKASRTKSEELLSQENYSLISLPKIDLEKVKDQFDFGKRDLKLLESIDGLIELPPVSPEKGRFRKRNKGFLYDKDGAARKFAAHSEGLNTSEY